MLCRNRLLFTVSHPGTVRSISVPAEGSITIFASACDQDGVLRVIDIRSNRNGKP